MIEWLALRDYAIVPSLELDLGPGLTVLTGETGAGKSIIVDALALLLGGRADTEVVRPGCAAAEIQGRFVLPADGEAAAPSDCAMAKWRATEAKAESHGNKNVPSYLYLFKSLT